MNVFKFLKEEQLQFPFFGFESKELLAYILLPWKKIMAALLDFCENYAVVSTFMALY